MLCASNMFGVVVSAILLSTVTDLVQSLYVPHPELHGAIVHKKIMVTWDEAKLRCEKEGAVLASPIDNGMLEYMKSSIGVNNHNTPYFIGMRLIDNPEHTDIVSVEGIPLDDLPQAALDMIEKIDPRDGDCLRMDSHEIRTGPCKDRLPYICYKNTTTDITTTSAPEVTTEVTQEETTETKVDCAAGYTQLISTGNYYKLHDTEVNWEQANSTCASEGSYLVVINNAEEAQAVKKFAFPTASAAGMASILTGIRKSNEDGSWRSVRGEPLDQIYHKWAQYRSMFEEECAVFQNDGVLNDVKCSTLYSYQHPFVCEKSCPN